MLRAALRVLTCGFLWLIPTVATAGDAETIFCIGKPDATAGEFGLVRDGHARFPGVFPGPVVFAVGHSEAVDWPFVHPAPRDDWAGSRVHPFSVEFDLQEEPGTPFFLVIGLAGAHPLQRSRVVVSVNGRDLPARIAPAGAAETVFAPADPGEARTLVFPVPLELVGEGANRIAIRLEEGSWIVYDYVALRTVGRPLPIRPPEIADAVLDAMAPIDEIVFAVRKLGPDAHWYANIGYYADSGLAEPLYGSAGLHGGKRVTYRAGGRLGKLNVETGAVAYLIDDPQGGVRDPVLHYDGETILFSWRKGNGEHYHLYCIRTDGTGLEQLTRGAYDDFEPCWLPDGGIAFVSTRAKRWVNCWVTQVATLHRMEADGSGIRPISANIEHDNTPWVLPDGRLIYQRWEYVDRSQVDYHHLWSANPDGSGQMVLYGNLHPGVVMIDAKPIPASRKVVAIFSPGHGQPEHDGAVVVLDPSGGPDDRGGARYVSRGHRFRDPWAFSEEAFLTASGVELLLMDGLGRTSRLFRLPEADVEAGYQCHEPRPVMPRAREHVVPPRVRVTERTGRLILADVYRGRNMAGVRRGDVRKLLVVETLPKPVNFTGGMEPLTYGGSFTLERILGTVPVEADGSAYLEVPALRGLFFVALDENDLAVKRMQSFLSVQPGEVTGCVGCHEPRTQTYVPLAGLDAVRRAPSEIEPIADCPDVFDFPRDIQPILDRLCGDCHGYEVTPAGGPYAGEVILTGDRGPMFSHAYFTATVRRLFFDGRNQARSNYPPRSIGSSASRLLQMLDGTHHDVRASAREQRTLRLWIETGAPYPGTYAALGCGSIGGYSENLQVHADYEWPSTREGAEAIARRCGGCHQGEMTLPRAISDEIGISFWRFSLDDSRLRMSRHILFNLSRPERSLLLLAPLARSAGGWELCRSKGDAVRVFESTEDPDYRALLQMVAEGKRYLAEIKRFDMPGFRPRAEYIREMQRYGVLPAGLSGEGPVDPYRTDRAYWRSLWHRPPAEHR